MKVRQLTGAEMPLQRQTCSGPNANCQRPDLRLLVFWGNLQSPPGVGIKKKAAKVLKAQTAVGQRTPTRATAAGIKPERVETGRLGPKSPPRKSPARRGPPPLRGRGVTLGVARKKPAAVPPPKPKRRVRRGTVALR